MKCLSILSFLLLAQLSLQSQNTESKDWCLSICNLAGDEKHNTELIHLKMENDSIMKLATSGGMRKIPLRIAVIQTDSHDIEVKELELHRAVANLNEAYHDAHFIFYLDRVNVIVSPLNLEDLSQNHYQVYNDFSDKHDLPDVMSVYIFDHGREFCEISGPSISCGRTGGFSYILSERTNNIVMSRFDISDVKVFAHEMGHFWGLYHTFEEAQFGKDDFDPDRCGELGDSICDTPPDPGAVYEVYVNYTTCELSNLTNDAGKAYKPMIENYMSYYKPCYLREFSFTHQQLEVMMVAATQPIRKKFVRSK